MVPFELPPLKAWKRAMSRCSAQLIVAHFLLIVLSHVDHERLTFEAF